MNICNTLAYSVEISQESLTNLLADIPESLARAKTDQKKWSVTECVEHLFIVEKAIVRLLTKPAPAKIPNDETPPEKFGADKIRHILSNREKKYPAPDMFTPKGSFLSLKDAKTALTALRAELAQSLREGKVNFSAGTVPHPVMGEFTNLDWVNFLIAHASRHYKQIEEIKMGSLSGITEVK